MKKSTKNWIATAQYDIETAEHMYKTGRYIYVIFFCHLAVEKLLKAIVSEIQDKLPPKTHNLRYLIKLAGIDVPPRLARTIDNLNTVSVPTRYPDDFDALQKQFREDVVADYLTKTKELLAWLSQDKRLQE